MPHLICVILQAKYFLKSIKIKTWFTEEEALKFSTFLVENEYDANMIRCRAPKCMTPADNKLVVRLTQLCDFGSLISRTYVFTGSKRLNKTHFEDESGEQERFSIFRIKARKIADSPFVEIYQSLKYWMTTLTFQGLLLLSGIHESATSMLETKFVGDNFWDVGDRFEMSVTVLN